MIFMNEWDIRAAADRYQFHQTLGPATRFLEAHMEQVNAHSDGWPYWEPPVKAAAKLITLIKNGTATKQEVRAALSPIKAFYTRRGFAAGMAQPPIEI